MTSTFDTTTPTFEVVSAAEFAERTGGRRRGDGWLLLDTAGLHSVYTTRDEAYAAVIADREARALQAAGFAATCERIAAKFDEAGEHDEAQRARDEAEAERAEAVRLWTEAAFAAFERDAT